MKYNALFEYVIRTSGENTDDIDDFDDRDNFWAPIPENLLFERILREYTINANPIRNAYYHIKHANDKNYQYYYGKNGIKAKGSLIRDFPEKFGCYNKERYMKRTGETRKFVSKEIRDDNNKQIIGWIEYYKETSSHDITIIRDIKWKSKNTNNVFNYSMIKDVAIEFKNMFEIEKADFVIWYAIDNINNPVIKSYNRFVEFFGKKPIDCRYIITKDDWNQSSEKFCKKYIERFK